MGAGRVFPGTILALQKANALDGAAPDDADGGDLQRRIRQLEVVPLAVGLLEPAAQESAVLARKLFQLEAAGDLDVLQVVATVRVQVEAFVLLSNALPVQPFIGSRDEPLDRSLQFGGRRLLGGAQVRLRELVLDVGGEEPEGAHHAWGRGYDHRPRPDKPPEGVRMHRAGTAERDEAELPGVVAALDAHHAQRGVHVLVDDGQYRLCRLLDAHPQLLCNGPDGLSRRFLVHLQRASQGDAGRYAVQHDVRVGDGRGLTAAPVGRRPRVGARARRPDLKGATRRDERDGAPARPDAVDVHSGGFELEVTQLDVAPHGRLAVQAERHVGRGSAHVESEDVGDPDLTRQIR